MASSRLSQSQTRAGKIPNWYKSYILKWGLEERHLLEPSNIYYLFQACLEAQSVAAEGWFHRFSPSGTAQPCRSLRLRPCRAPNTAINQLINQQIKLEAYFHGITSGVACPFQASKRRHRGCEGGARAGEAEAWPQVGFSWWRALASISSHTVQGCPESHKNPSHCKAAPGIPWQAFQRIPTAARFGVVKEPDKRKQTNLV